MLCFVAKRAIVAGLERTMCCRRGPTPRVPSRAVEETEVLKWGVPPGRPLKWHATPRSGAPPAQSGRCAACAPERAAHEPDVASPMRPEGLDGPLAVRAAALPLLSASVQRRAGFVMSALGGGG